MRTDVAPAPQRQPDRPEPEAVHTARPSPAPSAVVRSTHTIASVPVHAPRDPVAEREAHATARRLVGVTVPESAVPPANPGPGSAARAPGPARPARPVPRTTAPPDRRLGAGRALTARERARYEPALGMDLAAVRVHDGPAAKVAARERRAHGFTYGNHVVLGGEPSSPTRPGRDLVLAHELAHVRQQARPVPGASARTEHPGRGPPVAPVRTAPLGVQCFEAADRFGGFLTETAGKAADLGGRALDTAVELGGDLVGGALETASAVVDRLAPGLLDFVRGGALGRLRELLCTGVGTLVSTLFSSVADVDPMSAIETTFTGLAQGVRDVQARLGGAASATVGALLRPVVAALQEWDGPVIQTLQSAATALDAVFSGLWDNLAAPAIDILGRVGGAVWETFNGLVTWIWDVSRPVREGFATAWTWLTGQFGLAWDSASGVREWLAGVASSAWRGLLAAIEPVRGPLTVAAGVLVALSPLGPVLLIARVVPPLWDALTWLWQSWNSPDVLVTARTVLQERVLPAVMGTVAGVADALGAAATWVADVAGQVGTAMSGVLGAVGTSGCLAVVTGFLTGVANQFARLATWARGGFSGLTEALGAVFDALVAIFGPILGFLGRLAMAVANPLAMPVVLAAVVWQLCPDDLKPPVIAFVLDLLIVAVTGLGGFLTALGPLGVLVKEGVLGFLRQLRNGPGIEDAQRIDATNKIATLATGGSVAFVAGMTLGIVEGVVDGIIDPFRLIFMLAQLLVAASRAVARVVATYAPGLAPVRAPPGGGASTAGEAPAPSIAGAPAAVAAPAPTTAVPAATTGEVGSLPPAVAGPVASQPAAAGPAVVPGQGPAGAGGAEAALLAPVPGEARDADIVAAMSPATLTVAAAAGATTSADPASLESEMRAEVQSEGQSVTGLASLLGEAWAAMVTGAQSLGARAATALLEFILLPDFELGRKIGFVAGFLLLQGAIMYFTAGGYAALRTAEGPLKTFLKFLLRFLDLGGELLGVLGRALRPLRGPLLRGIGAARGFLSRFRFAAGFMESVESLAVRLLALSDEAAGAAAGRAAAAAGETAAGRAAREGAEAGAARAVRESAEAGAARTVREGAETGAARTARESAEVGAARTAREGTEEAGERAVTQQADELGEGAVRAADEPGVPTVRDQALKTTQFGQAMIEARAIESGLDALDAPVPMLLASLMALKRRYRWIDTFTATPVGIGVYDVELVASPGTPVGRYTVGGGAGAPPSPLVPPKKTLDRIADTFEDELLKNPALMRRFEDIERLATTNADQAGRLAADLERELAERTGSMVSHADETTRASASIADLAEPGIVSPRRSPGARQPIAAEAGNFTHRHAEALRDALPPPKIPSSFAADAAQGNLVPLSQLPDHLLAEKALGVTSRVDRITPTTVLDEAAGVIYEIKPDNAAQIAKGFEQAAGYVRLANATQRGGRADWRAVVVVYNQAAAKRMIR